MITSKQRAKLRSLANPIDTILQVGKGGIEENLVIQVADALKARELIKMRVLETAPVDAREAAQILALNCITTVGSLKSACVLNEAAGARRVRAKAHIKIDTGLSRYGFTCREAETAARELKKMDWIDFEGIYTHFSLSLIHILK